jgi:hypothetical protein
MRKSGVAASLPGWLTTEKLVVARFNSKSISGRTAEASRFGTLYISKTGTARIQRNGYTTILKRWRFSMLMDSLGLSKINVRQREFTIPSQSELPQVLPDSIPYATSWPALFRRRFHTSIPDTNAGLQGSQIQNA